MGNIENAQLKPQIAEREKIKTGTTNKGNKEKTVKNMVNTNPTVSIITLNVSGTN